MVGSHQALHVLLEEVIRHTDQWAHLPRGAFLNTNLLRLPPTLIREYDAFWESIVSDANKHSAPFDQWLIRTCERGTQLYGSLPRSADGRQLLLEAFRGLLAKLEQLTDHVHQNGAWSALGWLSRAFPAPFWRGFWTTLMARRLDVGAADAMVLAMPKALYQDPEHMLLCHNAFRRVYQFDDQLLREGVGEAMRFSNMVLLPRPDEIGAATREDMGA